ELNNESLKYLATKLFGNNPLNTINDLPVSWTMFTKEQLNTNHVISDWIFCALKLSKDNLKYLWDENLILGFISKSDAEEKLLNKQKGTFLLRFSDSALGAISIAAVGENNEVFMVEPWSLKHFNARSLADRIMDIPEITHLYPDIPKEVAFAKHCNVNEECNTPKAASCSNYVQAILTTQLHPFTRLDFNSNMTSPSQQSDYSDDYNKQLDIE
ncbi:signal transducer and activator of transcription 5B-like protein, partial [Leptotrombidium deliense]